MKLPSIYIFLMTNAELVPPNPKLLLNTVLISVSTVLAAILSFSEYSSGFSKFTLGATKLFCIIKVEYTISDAPAIQHSCPVIPLVEEIKACLPSNILAKAIASYMSP